MMLLFRIFASIVFLASIQGVFGSQVANRLFEDLFSSYKKLNRPVEHPEQALRIQVQFKLLQIVDVHEKNQVLRTNGWLVQKWNDYRLRWDPREYGNLTMIHVPGQLLFLPDLCLYNNAHGSPIVVDITKADVYYTGDIVWEPPVAFKSLCKIQIEWFPYDSQNCELMFGSWTFGGDEIDLVFPDSDVVEKVSVENSTVWKVRMGIDISEYQESVEWDLLSVEGERHEKRYPCCNYPVIDITYYIHIRRKKLFYTVNMMFPCIGLAALTSFVFYLPCESHNKIQLCISILVALTFFLLILIDIIPPTSIAAPLIGQYLCFIMVMASLSITMTVLVQNLYYRGEQPMPRFVRTIFIHILGKYVLIFRNIGNRQFHRRARYKNLPTFTTLKVLKQQLLQVRSQSCRCASRASDNSKLFRSHTDGHKEVLVDLEPEEMQIDRETTVNVPLDVRRRFEKTGRNIRYIERTLKRSRQQEELAADWQFVAMVLDRIMLIVFSVVIFIGTLLATTSAPSLRDIRQPINTKAQSPWLMYEGYLNDGT